ncbi:MAG: ImmA/IrrE family metallo-endopeptidase [Bacteroidetes bacterium]|nr:ImmA/IrrE family metallo-endopeptidase [Bacteroidota bacterium]
MRKNRAIELEIEKKAFAFRQLNGLSSAEPIRLKSLLLKNNVLTVFKPLSESFSGMALKTSDQNRFIMVNSEQSLGKQHFTIGHELYHLFVQENFISQKCSVGIFDGAKDPEEYRADLFAAFLLLPEEGIKQMIPDEELKRGADITLQTILKIENYYSVSRRALLYRLFNLEFIKQAKYDEYLKTVMKGARQNGYPTHLYERGNANEIIGDYGVLANKLLEVDKISESHYLELMGAIGFNPLDQSADDENGRA